MFVAQSATEITNSMLHDLSSCSKRTAPSVQNQVVDSVGRQWRRMRAHKLAVVEASLAPFKYAFFEALGYAFVRAAGIMCDPSDTLMTYAKYGLIGGTILAIPYLICLLAMVEKGEEDAAKGTMREHMILMTAEIVYSAIAACVGSCALGRSHGCTFSAIAVGAIGSVVSFALLYFMLGAVFAVLWSVMRLKNWVISPRDL